MATQKDLDRAKEIVKKSRHYSISATGDKYEPIKKFVEKLHKNIASALTSAGLKGFERGLERCLEIANAHFNDSGELIGNEIRSEIRGDKNAKQIS